jgi:hypothetical protein
MTETSSSSSATTGVVLLPPERFFARRVPLVAGTAPGSQVELALENFSPFPIDQLYHGYVTSPAQDEALVYASHRKQFAADEASSWNSAATVLPAFVALLGEKPAAPTVRVWRQAGAVTAAAWDGKGTLPVAVIARGDATEGVSAKVLAAELRERTGLALAAVEEFSGEAHADLQADGRGLSFRIATPSGERTGAIGRSEAATADVREKLFLAEMRRTGRRDLILWRMFLACVIGLGGFLVLELALIGSSFVLGKLKDGVQQRAPAVEKISTAQALSERIEELAGRRLMPFEMLVVLNRARPGSVNFSRVTTTDRYSLEVEAQTNNATDAGAYEAALRALPELAKVETRDLRSRDNITTFVLAVTFKPEALRGGNP